MSFDNAANCSFQSRIFIQFSFDWKPLLQVRLPTGKEFDRGKAFVLYIVMMVLLVVSSVVGSLSFKWYKALLILQHTQPVVPFSTFPGDKPGYSNVPPQYNNSPISKAQEANQQEYPRQQFGFDPPPPPYTTTQPQANQPTIPEAT